MKTSPDVEESFGCSEPGCSCGAFRPGSVRLRSCDLCGHGWVAHALEKLQARPASSCGPAEVALPGPVLDLSSLVLYGAQAVPVRLKILLDRLYSVLSPEQAGQILLSLGWTLGDYIRGYMLQDPSGDVLDRWSMVSPEEEPIVLEQFLRFGETRPIVELMTKNGTPGEPRLVVQQETIHLCPNVPPSMLRPHILQTSRGRDAGGHGRGGQRTGKDLDFVWKPADPDRSSPLLSLWHQDSGCHKGRTRRKTTLKTSSSSLSPPVSNSSSSSLSPPVSNLSSLLSPPVSNPSLQRSSLPSFSSSFLRPLHTSSFPVPMAPLPPSSSSSSLLPLSLGGCQKGRVSCGVCGKSFYDKGTLKIHYNAVHLKIKHRCTIVGCSMVFSSLRSRNRHSANPNPRLHAGACGDAHLYRAAGAETRMVERLQACGRRASMFHHTPLPLNGHFKIQHGRWSKSPPPLSLRSQTVEQNSNRVVGPNHFHNRVPKLLLPAGTASSRTGLVTNQQRRSADASPKKKPRKSSTPMKIKRENRRHEDNDGF